MRPVDGGEVSPSLPQPHSPAQANMGAQEKSSSPFPATDTKKGRRSVLFLFPPRVQPPPVRPETGLSFSSHPLASNARSDRKAQREGAFFCAARPLKAVPPDRYPSRRRQPRASAAACEDVLSPLARPSPGPAAPACSTWP